MTKSRLSVILWRSIRSFGLIVVTYVGISFVGAHIPRNPDWSEPSSGVAIYVASNGHHTGLILPASGHGVDWLRRAKPDHLPDPQGLGRWLLFGWGDRDFYLNTPTWDDVSAWTAIVAITGTGSSLVHVDHLDDPADAVTIRPLRLRRAEYLRLAAFIEASFAEGGPVPGYGQRDVFYPARGRYSMFYTCNSWVGDALAAAGVRVGLWTPFAGGIMRWFEPAGEGRAVQDGLPPAAAIRAAPFRSDSAMLWRE